MPARVMIVEDDLNIAMLLRYNLEAAGYAVEHVTRGDEAERCIAESAPDLLVLDWMLPGLSGIELCRRIRKRVPMNLLPIIVLTARLETSDRDYAIKLGANHYMTKPFSLCEILSRTRSLLQLASSDADDAASRSTLDDRRCTFEALPG